MSQRTEVLESEGPVLESLLCELRDLGQGREPFCSFVS